jgi:hypothetical protein
MFQNPLQFSKINPARSQIELDAMRQLGPPVRPNPPRLRLAPNPLAPQVPKSPEQILPGRGQR